jgi:hypothetical protein
MKWGVVMLDLYEIAKELSAQFITQNGCQGFGVGKRGGDDILVISVTNREIKKQIKAYLKAKYPEVPIKIENVGKISLL